MFALEINQVEEIKMGHGGRRVGAGRPVGATTKKTRRIVDATTEAGLPLAYMLRVMNDETVPVDRRDKMAIAASGFCHPRLSAVAIAKDDDESSLPPIEIIVVKSIPSGTFVDEFDSYVRRSVPRLAVLDGQTIDNDPPPPAAVDEPSSSPPVDDPPPPPEAA